LGFHRFVKQLSYAANRVLRASASFAAEAEGATATTADDVPAGPAKKNSEIRLPVW
jgi:hypothetical protein